MKMKIYLFIVLSLIFANLSIAQNKVGKKSERIKITGSVVDQYGKPLSGVYITLDEGANQTVSDAKGAFSLLGKPTSMLLFELSGYEVNLTAYTEFVGKGNVTTLIAHSELNDLVYMPFRTQERSRAVGNLSILDPGKEFYRDSRSNLASAIDGKIAGSSGGINIDYMASTVVIDGVPTSDYGYLDLREIEQVTILKDIASRILYGVYGNNAIILVTTRGGDKNKKVLKFDAEYGVNQAIGYPKFLDAANYMTTYNKAWINDGGTGNLPYSQDIIDKTKAGTDPVLYPNNDFYGTDYVRSLCNALSLYTEASGGNSIFQYFMDLSWKNSNNFININPNINNSLKARGKVDAKITNWLEGSVNSMVTYDLSSGPIGATSFWSKASTFLPNSTPILIPTSRISNYSDIASPRLVNKGGIDYLLGGTQTYQDNLFGDQTMQGTGKYMNRFLLLNSIFDFDLSGITKGLKARATYSFDARDSYNTYVRSQYAIYQINRDSIHQDGTFPVTKIGVDQITNKQTIEEAGVNFVRNYAWNTSINYNRTFGKHYLSSVLVGWGNRQEAKLIDQPDKSLGIGWQATYMLDEKYQVDAGLVFQGSYRVAPEHKWGSSPSIGLGWVISKEKFMKNVSFINYLKLHGSFGIIENDNWTDGGYNGYFLNEINNVRGGGYSWNNGLASGIATHVSSLNNKLDWAKRKEWVFDIESTFLNNTLHLNASYFNSLSYDNISNINSITPATIGEVTIYQNYNSSRNQGVEFGVNYQKKINRVDLGVGVNYTFSYMETVKLASPYNQYLNREGTNARAFWGLTAEGFYMPSDFGVDGKLLPTLPVNTFDPNVKTGDIKYTDYNKDGQITTNDQHILANNNANNSQVGLTFDLKYDKWELHLLAIGQFGGKGSISNDYYWFTGNNAKYSKIALDAFDPEKPDPNAAYPRLTLGNGTNNYRSSTFWMYDKSYINLSSMQIAHNFNFKNIFVKNLKLYLRGSNLVTIARDREILDLSYLTAPQSRNFSIGLITNF
ncbi:MAG: SusC/RagA family TonB-linked outer membrane protein [Prolixibacteraceae bacterium]|jgi:TonB-linked SusC/RagA family outer membrane protein|nr:SusC/RagA family TonB-linked outer membrane protein [Prolixibacteraceae bacterium]